MRSAFSLALMALATTFTLVSADWEIEYHTTLDCTDEEPKVNSGTDDSCVKLEDTVDGDYMSIKYIGGSTRLYNDDDCSELYTDPNDGADVPVESDDCFGATEGLYIDAISE